MRYVFITIMNISLSVSILYLLLNLVYSILKTRYSIRWKHFAYLLLGLRLILPINLGVLSLPVLPIEDGYHQELHTDATQDSSIIPSTSEPINMSSVDSTLENTGSLYPLDSPNDSLLDSNTDQSLQNKQLREPFSFSITRLIDLLKSASLTPYITAWLVGAIIFLSSHLLSYIAFHQKIRRHAVLTDNSTYLASMQEQKQSLHITKDIPLLIYKEISSPLLLGYRKPCIILPDNNYTKDQITFILKHELTHYKHHDLYIKLLLIVSNSLHWFNPIIYLLVRDTSLTMELYCDEGVTAKQTLSYREQYSLTLLEIMKGGGAHSLALLSTSFTNNAKHTKERFRHIMNTSTKKKGSILIILTICIILIGSNLTTGQSKKSANADTIQDFQPEKSPTDSNEITDVSDEKTETITNILILGLDAASFKESEYSARPDSILLLTLNKERNTATFNTILRDILVDIPGYEKNKISNAYVLGGLDLMKTTLNHNFGITIDHSIAIDMNGLETFINLLGGTEITLSAQEATYLNKTNFISNKSFRNVVEGMQNLNGNQTLGYLRLRYVPTANGESNDYGRTKRLIEVLKSLSADLSSKNLNQLLQLATDILPWIATDMSLDDISYCLESFLSSTTNVNYTCIPRFEDCTSSKENGMSVLTTDIEQSKKLFSEYLQ